MLYTATDTAVALDVPNAAINAVRCSTGPSSHVVQLVCAM